MSILPVRTTNTILYCRHWAATVAFYRDGLGLPLLFENDWFVEFGLGETARLSVADERRATIKSSAGAGITLTFEVEDVDAVHAALVATGLTPGAPRSHAWGARVFYLRDPEGHRLEFWMPNS